MSRTLFDHVDVPITRNRKRSGTVLCSVILHGALLLALVALQFGTTLDMVAVNRPVVFALPVERPPVLPPPPPRAAPPAATPAERLNPDAAPTVAATAPSDNPPTATSGPPAPGPMVVGSGPGLPIASAFSTSRLAPPPAPKPAEAIRVGGVIKAPERLFYAKPAYPAIAQTARVDGTVILEATIDETGSVKNVRVLRSIPLLDQAAIDAVAKWRYTPTRLNGAAVPVVMTVTVTFTLR